MATDPNTLNDRELTLVRNTLDAADLAERLLEDEGQTVAIGFAEIHAYATRPDHNPSDALLRALDSNSRVRRDFETLLKNVSAYWMPQVAAASSGEISTREIDGCRMTFRASKADEAQIFIIIEFTDKSARPNALFVCGQDKPMSKVDLPDARDGRIQLLLDADSDIVKGLRDFATEVFLR
jgi:hypothetical protein